MGRKTKEKMGSQARKKSHQKQVVLGILKQDGIVKTNAVSELLNVSECTVRRLFDELEANGDVVRVYGGIKLVQNGHENYLFDKLQKLQLEQKVRIGKYASSLVETGDNIWIDSGTTAEQMAMSLLERLKHKEIANIQVFSNSQRNIEKLADYCEVNLVGGLFRKNRQDYCGYLTEIVLEAVSFKKSFLGADGISPHPDEGIMTMDAFTAKISNLVVNRSDKSYLMVDSTKLNRRSLMKFASIDQVSNVITDEEADEEGMALLQKVGARVIKV